MGIRPANDSIEGFHNKESQRGLQFLQLDYKLCGIPRLGVQRNYGAVEFVQTPPEIWRRPDRNFQLQAWLRLSNPTFIEHRRCPFLRTVPLLRDRLSQRHLNVPDRYTSRLEKSTIDRYQTRVTYSIDIVLIPFEASDRYRDAMLGRARRPAHSEGRMLIPGLLLFCAVAHDAKADDKEKNQSHLPSGARNVRKEHEEVGQGASRILLVTPFWGRRFLDESLDSPGSHHAAILDPRHDSSPHCHRYPLTAMSTPTTINCILKLFHHILDRSARPCRWNVSAWKRHSKWREQ